jgi:pyruvate-ferredoxin/flavodoxin oxidoreductase
VLEAEAHPGPSIIVAYSHCIAHGYNLLHGFSQQKAAVESGHFPLFHRNPALAAEGKNPFQLDSKAPKISFDKYAYNETRYTMLVRSNPEAAKALLELAQQDAQNRYRLYEHMASMPGDTAGQEVK